MDYKNYFDRNYPLWKLIENIENIINSFPDSHLGKYIYDRIISRNLFVESEGHKYLITSMMANRDHFQFSMTGSRIEETSEYPEYPNWNEVTPKIYKNFKLTGKYGVINTTNVHNFFGALPVYFSIDKKNLGKDYIHFKLLDMRVQDELSAIKNELKKIGYTSQRIKKGNNNIQPVSNDKQEIKCIHVKLESSNKQFFNEYDFSNINNLDNLINMRNFLSYHINKFINFFIRCYELKIFLEYEIKPFEHEIIYTEKRTAWKCIINDEDLKRLGFHDNDLEDFFLIYRIFKKTV